MLISCFTLQNGTLITLLLKFHLEKCLVCTKKHRHAEYAPQKFYNSFWQSAVDATRQRDEHPTSSVVAETMKLLAISSYGYQIMDRNRHAVTKYLNDQRTHDAFNVKLIKKLNHVDNALYEVELAKSRDWTHGTNLCRGFWTTNM